MFHKLKRLCGRTIFICLILFNALIAFSMYFTVRNTILSDAADLARQNISQYEQNISASLKLTEEASRLFTENSEVQVLLSEKHKGSAYTPLLNNVQMSDNSVLGITMIDRDSHVFSSSGIAPQNIGKELEKKLDFTAGNSLSFWMHRINNLPYSHTGYAATSMGVFSYVSPVVSDKGVTLAYVIVDIDALIVPSIYQTFESSLFAMPAIYFIQEDNSIIPSVKNISDPLGDSLSESRLLNNVNSNREKSYLISTSSLGKESIHFACVIHLNTISILGPFILWLVLLFVLLAAASFFISRLITNSIILPLAKLYQKIKDVDPQKIAPAHTNGGDSGNA